jgi:uncharacterized protein
MSNENESEEEKRERLRKQLDEFHDWPTNFTFKFVLTNDPEKHAHLKRLFKPSARITTRASRTGKYVSFTIVEHVENAEEIFVRYEEAGRIEGIISL